MKPTVCVDVNGVLDMYVGWRGPELIDDPRPGAREFLQALNDYGYRVVLLTTRHESLVRPWLEKHGLSELVGEITDRKPAAHVYVDDRAVCFRGDFNETLGTVLQFKAHWEDLDGSIADGSGVPPQHNED